MLWSLVVCQEVPRLVRFVLQRAQGEKRSTPLDVHFSGGKRHERLSFRRGMPDSDRGARQQQFVHGMYVLPNGIRRPGACGTTLAICTSFFCPAKHTKHSPRQERPSPAAAGRR